MVALLTTLAIAVSMLEIIQPLVARQIIDQLVVIDNGKIVEVGSHASLQEADGVSGAMVRRQTKSITL